MTARPGRAGIRMAGLAAVIAALASGCVSLQTNGPVTTVADGDSGSSQVQIWPSPPTASESPTGIVTGFLAAARSGSANASIAEAYLNTDMQKQWKSEMNTVLVLADDSETYPQAPGQNGTSADQGDTTAAVQIPTAGQAEQAAQDTDTGDSGTDVTEQVQGDLLGTVDSSGVYSASSGQVTYEFGLTETKNGYRISSLPDGFGVLMERSDFESSYSRHNVYYENSQYGGKLIPAQIYLPAIDTDQELADAMAREVVQGVPDELGTAVQDAVQNAVIKSGVQFQGDGSAIVVIDSHGACTKDAGACEYLSQQLAVSLNSLSTKVTSVTVKDQSNNHEYSQAPDATLTSYGLSQGSRSGQPAFYAIADDGAVEQVSSGGTVSSSEKSYGPAKSKYKEVAVNPGQADRAQQLALVSQDGTKVYVSRRQDDSADLTQVYPSSATAAGGTVGGLSWDAYGDLWFTVAQGGATTVYRYGQDTLSQVAVTGLDGTITQVAAAPDGSRVAVGYKDSSGDSWISIGAVSQSGGGWQLDLSAPDVVAADWSQINDFDWYNEDSLAVLGIQPNSQVLGLYQVYTDGSAVFDSLTEQPVEAGPPANADSFVWSSGSQPIAAAVNSGKHSLYQLSVEGVDAQLLTGVSGISPSY